MPAMARRSSPALVLHTWEYGDSSQIVSLLTRDHGRVRGLAKGCLRGAPSARERFCGGFELFARGQLLWSGKPEHELETLTEWNLEEDRHPLRTDWRAQRLAGLACELCAGLLAPHDPHPRVFAALDAFLDAPAAPGALAALVAGLLVDSGHAPRLDRLADGRPPPAGAVLAFDPQAGGLSEAGGPPDWRMRAETAAWLQALLAGRALPAGGAHADSARRGERFLLVWCRHLLGAEPPALQAFLRPAQAADSA